ncbi:ANTAR domain-containing protein [Xanthobacter variabilis]|uniref:hypothetical protein n=1 Tax=Xanthobacter variabilis TaxID=3119932 RepID=UPI0037272D01
MKVLPTARILIVDSQVERREALRNSLIAFGVGGVQEAGSLEAVAGSMATGQPDVLIVHADNPDQIPENPYRDGNGAPAVLVAEAPTQALMRAAARGGYDAAVGAPAAPRLLYRRIGSVMQRARRVVRGGAVSAPASADQISGDAGHVAAAPLS